MAPNLGQEREFERLPLLAAEKFRSHLAREEEYETKKRHPEFRISNAYNTIQYIHTHLFTYFLTDTRTYIHTYIQSRAR